MNRAKLSLEGLLILSFVLLYLLTPISSIDQKCTPLSGTKTCPENSFCSINGFCICDEGWQLDCQTHSTRINQTNQTLPLSTLTNFTIVPSEANLIFIYKFIICPTQSGSYQFSLYADQGVQSELSDKNRFFKQSARFGMQCGMMFSPYMQFGVQPNGDIEQMILQVSVLKSSSSQILVDEEKTEGNGEVVDGRMMKISVTEVYIANWRTLWIVVISFVSLIGLTFLGGIIYCIYFIRYRRRRGWDQSDNNISYFDEYFPKKTLKANDRQILEDDCPICLNNFKEGEKVRTLLCRHCFHCECLDEWCKKRLTCPVCRFDLSQENINENLKEKQSLITADSDKNKMGNNHEEGDEGEGLEEEDFEEIQYALDKKSQIKNSLIS